MQHFADIAHNSYISSQSRVSESSKSVQPTYAHTVKDNNRENSYFFDKFEEQKNALFKPQQQKIESFVHSSFHSSAPHTAQTHRFSNSNDYTNEYVNGADDSRLFERDESKLDEQNYIYSVRKTDRDEQNRFKHNFNRLNEKNSTFTSNNRKLTSLDSVHTNLINGK